MEHLWGLQCAPMQAGFQMHSHILTFSHACTDQLQALTQANQQLQYFQDGSRECKASFPVVRCRRKRESKLWVRARGSTPMCVVVARLTENVLS